MIIIEGCDNTGETTLCKYLSEQIRTCEIVKSPAPRDVETIFPFLDNVYFKDLANTAEEKIRTIYDRFPCISDPIYARCIGWKSVFVSTLIGRLARHEFMNWNNLIIFCDPGRENVLKLGDREQMDGVRDEIEAIYTEYQYELGLLSLYSSQSIIKYDYTSHTPNEVLQYILRWHKKQGELN